jgi:hypothetical protein
MHATASIIQKPPAQARSNAAVSQRETRTAPKTRPDMNGQQGPPGPGGMLLDWAWHAGSCPGVRQLIPRKRQRQPCLARHRECSGQLERCDDEPHSCVLTIASGRTAPGKRRPQPASCIGQLCPGHSERPDLGGRG